jgi:hypothetical protein
MSAGGVGEVAQALLLEGAGGSAPRSAHAAGVADAVAIGANVAAAPEALAPPRSNGKSTARVQVHAGDDVRATRAISTTSLNACRK